MTHSTMVIEFFRGAIWTFNVAAERKLSLTLDPLKDRDVIWVYIYHSIVVALVDMKQG